jgi:NADPH:quinone reductase
VLVRVKAAGINPGEAAIRQGVMHARFPGDISLGSGQRPGGLCGASGSRG